MKQDIRTSILHISQSQIGITEATGRNDGIPQDRYSDGRQVPWCANFVVYCYRKAGVDFPGSKWLWPSVEYLEKLFQNEPELMWSPVGEHKPLPGDVIFFKRRAGSDKGRGRHVGLVEYLDPRANLIRTIEGNVSNSVGRRWRNPKADGVSGYGWAA